MSPLALACLRIHCNDRAENIVAFRAGLWERTCEALAIVKVGRLLTIDVSLRRILPGRDVEQSCRWAERWRIPVRSTLIARIHQRARRRRLDTRSHHRTALLIEAFIPIGL